MKSDPLITCLERDRVVSSESIEKAYQRQMLFGGRLGTNLLEVGALDELTLLRYLEESTGLPQAGADFLAKMTWDVVEAFPVETVLKYGILAIRLEPGILHAAVTSRLDRNIIHLLETDVRKTVKQHILCEFRFHQLLEKLFEIPMSKRYRSLVERFPLQPIDFGTIDHASQNSQTQGPSRVPAKGVSVTTNSQPKSPMDLAEFRALLENNTDRDSIIEAFTEFALGFGKRVFLLRQVRNKIRLHRAVGLKSHGIDLDFETTIGEDSNLTNVLKGERYFHGTPSTAKLEGLYHHTGIVLPDELLALPIQIGKRVPMVLVVDNDQLPFERDLNPLFQSILIVSDHLEKALLANLKAEAKTTTATAPAPASPATVEEPEHEMSESGINKLASRRADKKESSSVPLMGVGRRRLTQARTEPVRPKHVIGLHSSNPQGGDDTPERFRPSVDEEDGLESEWEDLLSETDPSPFAHDDIAARSGLPDETKLAEPEQWEAELGPGELEAEPGELEVELEPEPDKLEAEPEPLELEALPELEAVRELEAEPESLELEAEPESLELDAEPESLELEAEPESLELDAEPESLELDAEPESLELEAEPEPVEVEAEPEAAEPALFVVEPRSKAERDQEFDTLLAELESVSNPEQFEPELLELEPEVVPAQNEPSEPDVKSFDLDDDDDELDDFETVLSSMVPEETPDRRMPEHEPLPLESRAANTGFSRAKDTINTTVGLEIIPKSSFAHKTARPITLNVIPIVGEGAQDDDGDEDLDEIDVLEVIEEAEEALPEVLEEVVPLDDDDDVDYSKWAAQLESRDEAVAARAVQVLSTRSSKAVRALMERFPGRLRLDRFHYVREVPPPQKHSRVLSCLVHHGELAIPPLLEVLSSSFADERFYAVLTLSELRSGELLDHLFDILLDKDRQIGALGVRLLRSHAQHEQYGNVIKQLAASSMDADDRSIEIIVKALGELRNIEVAAVLVPHLENKNKRVVEATHNALMATTLTDLGTNTKKWEKWLSVVNTNDRLALIAEAMVAKERQIRVAVAEELNDFPGMMINFHPDAHRRERQRARQAFLDWANAHPGTANRSSFPTDLGNTLKGISRDE